MPMTAAEMLAEMGISQADFVDYWAKTQHFHRRSPPNQQDFHFRSLRTNSPGNCKNRSGLMPLLQTSKGYLALRQPHAGVIVMSCCK